MVLNQKPTGRASSIPAGLLFGAMASLGITLLAAALIAKLVSAEYIEESSIGYGIMAALLGASFAGALLASGKIKRQRLLVCTLSGLLYFLILLGITALFFGGQYEAVGVTGILVMGGSLLAVLTGGGASRGGRRRKHKSANR